MIPHKMLRHMRLPIPKLKGRSTFFTPSWLLQVQGYAMEVVNICERPWTVHVEREVYLVTPSIGSLYNVSRHLDRLGGWSSKL